MYYWTCISVAVKRMYMLAFFIDMVSSIGTLIDANTFLL